MPPDAEHIPGTGQSGRAASRRRGCHHPIVANVAAGLLGGVFPVASAVAQTPPAHVVRLDGTEIVGSWLGCRDGRIVEIQAEAGPQTLPLDDLSGIHFLRPKPGGTGRIPRGSDAAGSGDGSPAASDGATASVRLDLAGGGRIDGRLSQSKAATDAVLIETTWGGVQTIPFDRIAGARFATNEEFPKAGELFEAALSDRKPGEDALVTRGADDASVTRGRLESLSADGGSFVFADRARTFRFERVFGVVFASGAAGAPAIPMRACLLDGSVIPGRVVQADKASIEFETAWKSTVRFPVAEVTSLLVASERLVYLSDWKLRQQRVEGRLHREWPVRLDRNVNGGPIVLGGQPFEKGIGVHSRTELTYALDGKFDRFAATVGIDDSVRPRGSVVFQVSADGKTVFDSGALTGADAPRSVTIDMSGVKELTLTVDYADELDLSDVADWADARLIKPAAGTDEKRGGRSSD